MKAVAKKHKLNPVWLADPSNIQLIDSNGGLDAEMAKLKVRTNERRKEGGLSCLARKKQNVPYHVSHTAARAVSSSSSLLVLSSALHHLPCVSHYCETHGACSSVSQLN